MSNRDRRTVDLSADWIKRAKKAHAKALAEGRGRNDVIQFEGNEVVVAYLGYLIEYAETIFGKQGD
jgi:hypothetical protein